MQLVKWKLDVVCSERDHSSVEQTIPRSTFDLKQIDNELCHSTLDDVMTRCIVSSQFQHKAM